MVEASPKMLLFFLLFLPADSCFAKLSERQTQVPPGKEEAEGSGNGVKLDFAQEL